MHSFGGQVARRIREAREQVAALIGATTDEIIFTSCGTESDNAAIRSALATYPERRHIVTSRVEHPAVKSLCANLAGQGYRITELPVEKNGLLDMEQFVGSLTPDTAVVSLMWANNETGVLFPVEKAADLSHERGIPFHTDAVQSTGKIPIDMKKNMIDMLSFSGHKLHAPKGIGVLYVRKGTRFSPVSDRGTSGEGTPGRHGEHPEHHRAGKGMRTGCPPPGYGKQRREAAARQAGGSTAGPHPAKPGQRGHSAAASQHDEHQFRVRRGEGILLLMNEYGICASSGSACTSGSLQPSHVLRAMGVPFTMAHGSIRFSLSIYNTEEEIDFVIEKLPPIIERLRSMSPYWTSVAQACASV